MESVTCVTQWESYQWDFVNVSPVRVDFPSGRKLVLTCTLLSSHSAPKAVIRRVKRFRNNILAVGELS